MPSLGSGVGGSPATIGSCGSCTGNVMQPWQTKHPQQQLLSPSDTGGILREETASRANPSGSTGVFNDVLTSNDAIAARLNGVGLVAILAA